MTLPLVRYYKNGWHVAYLDRQEPASRKAPARVVLIPVIPGKKRITVPAIDVQPLNEPDRRTR